MRRRICSMGFGRLIRQRTHALLLVGATALGAGAAIAVGAVTDSGGVIHACISIGPSGEPLTGGANLRVLDTAAGQTCYTTGNPPSEEPISWNQSGPQGPAGPQGPPGPTGGAVNANGR